MNATKTLLCAATLLAASMTLTACDAGGAPTGVRTDGKAPASAKPAAAEAHITLGAADGQRNVSVDRGGRVTVSGGTLTHVTLTRADGGPHVAGALSDGGRSWQPAADLSPGTAYRLTAEATDGGRTVDRSAAFTTLAQDDRFTGTEVPAAGATVGVGMPVSFTFDKAITDRATVAAGIRVTSTSGQQVVGHWFGDRRVDFRPERYWVPGSTVTVQVALDGLRGGANAYGTQDETFHFTIGRSQVSTVDARSDTMKVVRNGKVVRTLPITAGAPGRTTWNGQMVIEQKLLTTRMDGATVGYAGQYDIPDVPHAMRLSDSGTFIHGNYWAGAGVFGHTNVSHGCVGLADVRGGGDPDQDAAWFYRDSLIGDVVIVKNSPDHTVAPDNGLNGWNMPWAQWVGDAA
ncbi:Ig-like domain-containing protein [Streptomyces sp. SL13]|uniref:Ig-like domain-containing protein n=1 Tax=Streptantibioticus silvisoli TaxID=2705255 RepID=A0AA90H303_9ACTN|nr:Ig-like domain-containing protein [Streptantibioticus silvisoli]MDI5969745.1 Ig-like domain-containing protein [Streptantibioticus silvisoli]